MLRYFYKKAPSGRLFDVIASTIESSWMTDNGWIECSEDEYNNLMRKQNVPIAFNEEHG